MLIDPQIITINSVAKSMPRVMIGDRKATYANSDGSFTLNVSHQTSNTRIRTMARVDQLAIVADPLTSVNDFDTLTFYSVLDRPSFGFTLAQCQQLVTGYKAWYIDALVAQLYGQES